MWPAAAVRAAGVGGGMCSARKLLRGGAGSAGGECDEDGAAPAGRVEEPDHGASPRRRRPQDEGEQVSAGARAAGWRLGTRRAVDGRGRARWKCPPEPHLKTTRQLALRGRAVRSNSEHCTRPGRGGRTARTEDREARVGA